MKTRERLTAFIVVGAIIALAILIHGLTANDQADVEAAATEVAWTETTEATEASVSDDTARDGDRTS